MTNYPRPPITKTIVGLGGWVVKSESCHMREKVRFGEMVCLDERDQWVQNADGMGNWPDIGPWVEMGRRAEKGCRA